MARTIGRSKSRPFSTGKTEGQEFQRLQRGLHVLQRNSGPKLLIDSFETKGSAKGSQRFTTQNYL